MRRRKRFIMTASHSRLVAEIGLPVEFWGLTYMLRALAALGPEPSLVPASLALLGHAEGRQLKKHYESLTRKNRGGHEPVFDDDLFHPGIEREACLIGEKLMQLAARGAYPGGTGAFFEQVTGLLQASLRARAGDARRFRSGMARLGKALRLDEAALDLVRFLFVFRHFRELDDLIDSQRSISDFFTLFRAASTIPGRQIRQMLSPRGPLYACGILDECTITDAGDIRLAQELSEYLCGIGEVPFFDSCVKRDSGRHYPLDSFTVPGKTVTLLRGMLGGSGPLHLLFHGKPGTGKTEFARALAAASGRTAYFVRNDSPESERSGRFLAITAGVTRATHENAILVVDEADETLSSVSLPFFTRPRGEKGRLNTLLDGIGIPVIWITNRTGGIDESTRRRFHYAVEFEEFTAEQRIALWKSRLARHPFRGVIDAGMIARLAGEFPVEAGPIGTALDTLPRVIERRVAGRLRPVTAALRAETERVLRELLVSYCLLGQVKTRPPQTASVKNVYDPTVLNLDNDRELLVENMQNWQAHNGELPEQERSGMALLFHGLPGTGKTAFARHLAGEMGRELVVKRASDLFSCYVGETEKNISRTFRRAEEGKKLLLVDEADSFLCEREGAHHSWEVSFVNEFLTQMEQFRGLLVCSTNLLARVDAASLRRFHWKVEFRPLDAAGRERLFARYFPQAAAALGERLAQVLAGSGALTPGDFHAVAERYRFGSRLPEPERLVEALLGEARIRNEARGNKPIGFHIPAPE